MRFSILTPHRGKDVQLLSTEVRATQQNPRYSVKNNVAIRLIATFMPKYNEIFNCLLCLYAISSVQQILLIIYCLSQIRYSCIYLKMDKTISNFLQQGSINSTTLSHKKVSWLPIYQFSSAKVLHSRLVYQFLTVQNSIENCN